MSSARLQGCVITAIFTSTGPGLPSDGDGSIEVINAGTEAGHGVDPRRHVQRRRQGRRCCQGRVRHLVATPVEERQKYLVRLNEALQARSADIASTIAGEVGMPHHLVDDDPGRAPRREHADVRHVARFVLVRGRRSATASSSRSPSVSSVRSRRGTTRSIRSSARSAAHSQLAAPSCSSPPRWHRSTPSSSPRSSTTSACPQACSTSSPAPVRVSAKRLRRTRRRHGELHRLDPRRQACCRGRPRRPSSGCHSSSAASRPTSSSTTPTFAQ